MIYLANAFSLNMLQIDKGEVRVIVKKEDYENFKQFIETHLLFGELTSAIGHEGTAQFLSELIGQEIKVNRVNLKINKGDTLAIVQLSERLPEGKVLSKEEVKEWLRQGKVVFYLVYLE